MNLRLAASRMAGLATLAYLLAAPAAYADAPVVTISAPGNGSSFPIGSNVGFTGSANDPEEGDLTASLDWTSSRDGTIGSGGSFSTSSLSAGTHTITASVTDTEPLTGSDSITITITDDPPSVNISVPSNGSSFSIGANINFSGSASDTEDGNITGNIDWTSSINGDIGSGGSFSTSSLSAGNHTITASVDDSDGNSDSDSINITVTDNAPDVNITGPSNNASFPVGANVNFSATANDDEDGNIAGDIEWTSNRDGDIGDGGSFSTSGLSDGNHTITASVTDSDGNSDSDSISITITNAVPSVNITQPSDNSSFSIGQQINFQANATDVEDNNSQLTSNISWSSSRDGNIGSGGSFNTSSLSAGDHTITASVTDSDGNSDSDTIDITVTNSDPNVNITSPSNNSNFGIGQQINFQASATDVEDNNGQLTSNISWSSNLDGNIGSGGSFNTSSLSAGNHTITASVTDSDGNSGSDSINVSVTDSEPTVNIDNPPDGASRNFGANINFRATASDAEDGSLNSSISWSSNVDGGLGTGGSIFVNSLSVGPHTITASVTDSDGNSDSDSISLTITNTVPNVTITSPSNNSNFPSGTSVNFAASATDAEDGNITGDITWNSSRDGNIGSGGSFSRGDLSAGDHQITASVTDSDGGSGSAQVNISITNSPPTASNVNISGNPAVNSTLTGNYTYNDDDGDPEGTSTFRWLRNGSPISGATSETYTVVVADVETDLRFEVTPVAQSGVAQGTAVRSAALTISNSAPSITGQTGAIEIAEDTSRTITLADLTVTDADNVYPDDFTLRVRNGTNYTRSGNTITPVQDFNGDLAVRVSVNDGFEDSAIFNLMITVTPVNDAPTFGGVVPPGLSTPEDQTLTIVLGSLVINDVDNTVPDDITLTIDTNVAPDANYTVIGPNAIQPSLNFNGNLQVRAVVNDGELDSAPFDIPVTVDSVNDLPTLVAPIGSQTFIEDAAVTLDISGNFDDADGETLTYEAVFNPVPPPERNIGFDETTGVFTGPPRFEPDDPGDPVYSVTVTARDSSGDPLASVSDTFDLTISQLGRANVGLSISVSPESALPNEQLQWTFTSENPVGPVAGENVELTGSFVGAGLTVGVEGGANCAITTLAGSVEFSCTIGMIPVGQTSSVVLTTTVSQTTEVVALATSAGALREPIDPNLANNSAVRAVGVAESFSLGAVQQLGNSTILSVDAGDVNGDLVADLVVGTESGSPVQIFLGAPLRESCMCQRDFQATPISIPDTGANQGVALADFDNNGTLDLVVANAGGQPDTVWLNDGAGNFAQSLDPALQSSTGRDVAIGDFNNDGNLDFAVAANSPNPVYFGNGDGSFATPILLGDEVSLSVAVGRLNGDNLDDLVFANVGAASEAWTKDAGGNTFTRSAAIALGDAAAAAAGDFNGDGVDDIVLGRWPTDIDDIPSNPVLINNGDGTFGAPREELGFSPTNDVLVGDVNGDGAIDLVFVSASGVHQIWSSAGPQFQLHGEQIIDIGSTAGVLAPLGETDNGNAGGIDLAVGGDLAAGVGVYLNDSLGNLGRGDIAPPVIELVGEATVSVASGTAYSDAGATATDNIDGDVTPVPTSDVNTAVVGSYTVTYNATDSAGNAAAPVSRTVTVTPATGRGGGGGGAIGYWAIAMLIGIHLLLLMRAQVRLRRQETKSGGRAGHRGRLQ